MHVKQRAYFQEVTFIFLRFPICKFVACAFAVMTIQCVYVLCVYLCTVCILLCLYSQQLYVVLYIQVSEVLHTLWFTLIKYVFIQIKAFTPKSSRTWSSAKEIVAALE